MSEGPKKVVAADGHVYHKSSSANATVAPTNQHTLNNADPDKKLGAPVAEFVTIIDYEWGLKGEVDSESICETYGYTLDEYTAFCNTPEVIIELRERGIEPPIYYRPVGDFKLPESKSPLTPRQLVAANAILDLNDNRSDRKKLQDLGITTATWNNWQADPKFNEYLRLRAENLFSGGHHEAMLALMDKVKARDMKAIELYLEMSGRFTKQSSSNQSGSSHDLQQIIVRIVEIIIEEVDEPEVAARIADRLKGLVVANSVGNALANPETVIVAPEIAVGREQTKEVQALMAQGVGYDG